MININSKQPISLKQYIDIFSQINDWVSKNLPSTPQDTGDEYEEVYSNDVFVNLRNNFRSNCPFVQDVSFFNKLPYRISNNYFVYTTESGAGFDVYFGVRIGSTAHQLIQQLLSKQRVPFIINRNGACSCFYAVLAQSNLSYVTIQGSKLFENVTYNKSPGFQLSDARQSIFYKCFVLNKNIACYSNIATSMGNIGVPNSSAWSALFNNYSISWTGKENLEQGRGCWEQICLLFQNDSSLVGQIAQAGNTGFSITTYPSRNDLNFLCDFYSSLLSFLPKAIPYSSKKCFTTHTTSIVDLGLIESQRGNDSSIANCRCAEDNCAVETHINHIDYSITAKKASSEKHKLQLETEIDDGSYAEDSDCNCSTNPGDCVDCDEESSCCFFSSYENSTYLETKFGVAGKSPLRYCSVFFDDLSKIKSNSEIQALSSSLSAIELYKKEFTTDVRHYSELCGDINTVDNSDPGSCGSYLITSYIFYQSAAIMSGYLSNQLKNPTVCFNRALRILINAYNRLMKDFSFFDLDLSLTSSPPQAYVLIDRYCCSLSGNPWIDIKTTGGFLQCNVKEETIKHDDDTRDISCTSVINSASSPAISLSC